MREDSNFIWIVVSGLAIICVLFFIYTTVIAANKYHKMKIALKNSDIVCEPVKIDDEYYCSTSILVNIHGVDDTFSTSKVEMK
jgi:hypothetical protein